MSPAATLQTPLLVLYGSETGNAQDVAERIGREAQLQQYTARVLPMDAYPVAQLPTEPFVIYVAATTGQGDPPSNMRRTWSFLLRRSLPPTSLAAMSYAVFGLGDSGYVKYNVMAKKLDRRLAGLGATPLVERGLGDDQHPSGYEAALDPWLTGLWAALAAACHLPGGASRPSLTEAALLELPPPKYLVEHLTGPPTTAAAAAGGGSSTAAPSEHQLQEQAVAAAAAFRALQAAAAGLLLPVPPATGGPSAGRPYLAPLVVNRRLTSPGSPWDTRHLVLDTRGCPPLGDYQPGDILHVFPRTPEAAVQAFLSRMGWDGAAWVRIRLAAAAAAGVGGSPAIPGDSAHEVVAPLRAIVQGVLDVAGCSPRRFLFQVLAATTTTLLEAERCAYFASSEGRDDLYRYNQRERRSLLEVLQDFPGSAPPLAWLLEAAPLLTPRAFSLASAPRAHPGEAHVCAAVVSWTTPSKRPRTGLVTTWLAGLTTPTTPHLPAATHQPPPGGAECSSPQAAAGEGSRVPAPRPNPQQQQQQPPVVPVWVERGALRLPPDLTTPLLLVGPGTGVAPFRSFLWQRAALKGSGAAVGPAYLFFGCRSAAQDFYYAEEWRQLQQLGVLDPVQGLITAFSRDPPEGQGDGTQPVAGQPPQQQQQQQQETNGTVQTTVAAAGGTGAPGTSSSGSSGSSKAGKVYVTHRLRQHGRLVWELLSQRGAWVYVSGSAQKMPADVAAALADVAVQAGGLSVEAGAAYVRQLELTGRYHVEAWS